MANPWIKKNPLLSMMLSGANAWAGAARGSMQAEGKRRQAAAMRSGARQATDFWMAAVTGAAPGKPARKKRRP